MIHIHAWHDTDIHVNCEWRRGCGVMPVILTRSLTRSLTASYFQSYSMAQDDVTSPEIRAYIGIAT